MKKLLLFALSIGVSSVLFAQVPTEIAVTSFVSPTGTVYIDGSGSGNTVNTIEIIIQNNDTVTFPVGAQFVYTVSVDGTPIADPTSTGWVRNLAVAIAPGETQSVLLTSNWGTSTTVGDHELCAALTFVTVLANPLQLYNNTDVNKELCQTFSFDFPVGINDIPATEISQIKMNGDLMTVFVKNSNAQAQIQIMSITGQVVKTVNASVSGQNFYQEINISDLTAGVYIITIQTENGATAAQKIMIQ